MKTEGGMACFGTLGKRLHMPPFELSSNSPRRNPTRGSSFASGRSLEFWQEYLEEFTWLTSGVPYYFLARGGSLETYHEAGLLWEEGVKRY